MRACAKGCGSLQREEMEAVAIFFLLLSLLAGGEGRKEDGSQYDVLGVSRDASQREIRSAYKRLARVWHPDKNRSPQAQEKILEINKAYEVSLAKLLHTVGPPNNGHVGDEHFVHCSEVSLLQR